jgi:hypothetical protein
LLPIPNTERFVSAFCIRFFIQKRGIILQVFLLSASAVNTFEKIEKPEIESLESIIMTKLNAPSKDRIFCTTSWCHWQGIQIRGDFPSDKGTHATQNASKSSNQGPQPYVIHISNKT